MLKQLFNRVPCMARAYQQSYLAINRLPTIIDQTKTFNLCHLSNSIRLFSDRRYSEKHEWVVMDNNKEFATVGITQYAQEALGDVVYVQLPEVDAEYKQDDEVGAVESVKAANEIYTPLAGTITEVNPNLEEQPNLINSSCYEDGWLFKIKIKNPKEFDSLMDESAYETYVQSMH